MRTASIVHPSIVTLLVLSAVEKSLAFSATTKGFGATAAKTYEPTNPELKKFLASHKAQVKNVEVGIGKDTGRRGLYAAKKFGKEDALICKIPSDIALALVDPAQAKDDLHTVECGVRFYQQYWSKPNEWWQAYLQTLPTQITPSSATPNLWSSEEIDLLEFPRLTRQAHERQQQLQAASQEHSIPLADLELATWLVSSRAFPIRLAEDGSEAEAEYDDRGQVILSSKANNKLIPVMVPLLDMANHDVKPNARLTLLDPEKDDAFFCLTSTRPIPKGAEITIGYGSGMASSIELLLNYGVVAEGNQLDPYLLKKGGDDCLESPSDWTTSLEDDTTMLKMIQDDPESAVLQQVLRFRIQMKESYSDE